MRDFFRPKEVFRACRESFVPGGPDGAACWESFVPVLLTGPIAGRVFSRRLVLRPGLVGDARHH